MSFTEDIKSFLVGILIGLGPLFLVAQYFFEPLHDLFQIDYLAAYILFITLYFILPFIIWLVWWTLFRKKTGSKEANYIYIISTIVCLTFLIFIFPQAYARLIYVVFVFTATGLIIWQAEKIKFSDKSQLFELRHLKAEFYIALSVVLLIGTLYILNNWEYIGVELTDLGERKKIIAGFDKDASDSSDWQKVINGSNYIGLLSLLSLLLILLASWFYASRQDLINKANHQQTEQDTSIIKNGDGYVVKTPSEFQMSKDITFFKVLILITTLLILPVFKPIDTKKDSSQPFLNLFGRNPLIVVNNGTVEIQEIDTVFIPLDTILLRDTIYIGGGMSGTDTVWMNFDYNKIRVLISMLDTKDRDSVYMERILHGLTTFHSSFNETGAVDLSKFSTTLEKKN